jgi:hypothetical protein
MTAVPTGPDLRLDLDVATVAAGARLHAAYSLHDGHVTGVVVNDTRTARSVSLDIAAWPGELEGRLTVPLPDHLPPSPAAVLEVPWDVLVGTGEALARHRPDVYDELVARAVGSARADGVVLDLAGAHEQLRRVHHSVLGRLQAVCSGTGHRGRRRIGWISWLLFADGWRALTPYAAGTGPARRAMVRVEPRRTADLAVEVACWVAAVRS